MALRGQRVTNRRAASRRHVSGLMVRGWSWVGVGVLTGRFSGFTCGSECRCWRPQGLAARGKADCTIVYSKIDVTAMALSVRQCCTPPIQCGRVVGTCHAFESMDSPISPGPRQKRARPGNGSAIGDQCIGAILMNRHRMRHVLAGGAVQSFCFWGQKRRVGLSGCVESFSLRTCHD